MMPKIDGYEACRILKANPLTKNIPVVLLTAKGRDIDKRLGMEVGATDYIVKPFSPTSSSRGSISFSPATRSSGFSCGEGMASVLWAVWAPRRSRPPSSTSPFRFPSTSCSRTRCRKRLRGRVKPGSRVLVPFGHRRVTGYAIEERRRTPGAVRIREIASLVDEEPLLTEELLDLARWMSSYYLHPLGEVLRAVLPSTIKGKGRPAGEDETTGKFPAEIEYPALTPDQAAAFEPIRARDRRRRLRALPAPRRHGEREDRGVSPLHRGGARAGARALSSSFRRSPSSRRPRPASGGDSGSRSPCSTAGSRARSARRSGAAPGAARSAS